MAGPARISLRTRKKINYREIAEETTDEDEIASETLLALSKPKCRKNAKKKADDDGHESGPDRKRRKQAAAVVKVLPHLCRDIWLIIFDYIIQDGDVSDIARFLGVNKHIGGFAYEALYRYRDQTETNLSAFLHKFTDTVPRLPADNISAQAMAQREVVIFQSLTPGETVYPYHLVTGHINPKALCDGILTELIDSNHVYKTILGIKPGNKGARLPIACFPPAVLADHVNKFIAGIADTMLPNVRDLSMVTIGIGIALPTVFKNLAHLSVEATNLHFDLGLAVAAECPNMRSLSISFPSGDPLGTPGLRRTTPPHPFTGPTNANSARFIGAMNFLEALPDDRLLNFELGVWSPTPGLDPNIINSDDEDEQQPPKSHTPAHLRQVGLEYEPSRMLLRALARHRNIRSLGLMRMEPLAYVDLPLLDKLKDSLVSLYIFLPDRIWGNVLRYPVPNHVKGGLVDWIRSLKKLEFLRWVSIDERQCRGLGNSWTWTEVLANGISKYHVDPSAPFGLQRLKELRLVLGLARLELFLRIEDLCSLEVFHLTTEYQNHMYHRHHVKVLTTCAPQTLALSIVRLPMIKSVTIIDRHFYVSPNFFPWPCTGGTLRRSVSSTAKYVRNPSSKAHPENRSLRHLHIEADIKHQGLGLWKFLAYFTNLRDLVLDVDHRFSPDAIYKWVRATNMEPRDVHDNRVNLYIPQPNENWAIPAAMAPIVDEYAIVHTKGIHMSNASKRLAESRYATKSIRFA